MIICIVSPGMPHDGNTLRERSLGGSETAAIQLAEDLAKIPDKFGNKNRVTVCSNCPAPITVNEVNYIPLTAYEAYISSADIDVLIVSRWQEPLSKPVNAKVVMYWCHDLALKRFFGQVRGILHQVDTILLMSQFQKEQYKKVYDLPESIFSVIRNGVDLDIFPQPYSKQREFGRMVYAARPERGLENLVKPGGIMETLLARGVPVTLSVAHYDNTTPEMKTYYDYLWSRCNDLPNVDLMGSLTKKQLYDLYSRSWLYLYPTEFEEISCISAMEAQACGLPFMTTPTAALVETLDPNAAIFIEGPASEKESQDRFVDAIIELINDRDKWDSMSAAGYAKSADLDWSGVAKSIIDIADSIMAKKTSDPVRLYKHFFKMSDIEMCLGMNSLGDKINGANAERHYIEQQFKFIESPEAYREHSKKVDGPINEEQKGATVEHYSGGEYEPRWMAMKEWIRQNGGMYNRVLDYGCWIGHQTIRVANDMPHAKVIGMDITQRNIDIAYECKKLHSKNDNVDFMCVDEMGDSLPDVGQFDLVFCNEVLEHVIDPKKLIETLEKYCRPGGTIFITTPYGPWEYQSLATFPYRCHLRHYEMNDLIDVFEEKENFQLWYKAFYPTEEGFPLGHHYVVYTNTPGRPTGDINIERKMRYQSPAETLSVCMIAYNAEDLLHRCLKSIRRYADEIIIALDPKTNDSTAEIAKRYGCRIIEGIDPIVNGFEEARNNSISQAQYDWILWIDSDEELLNSKNIVKYLRNNVFNGYAIQQHHLSVDPPIGIKPDLPIRLFRNNKGIKFYGVVHEHPEIELNKGVGQGVVLVDAWIAHDGYLTEAIRRRRFLRNIDLVVRDRAKYPERNLGHFLWLRDLIHLSRYRKEQLNGQGIDGQIIKWAEEAKALFEAKFFDDTKSPMLMDAIQYYSEANTILNIGNVLKFSLALPGQDTHMIEARFPSAKKAGEFLGNLTRDMMSEMEGKYI